MKANDLMNLNSLSAINSTAKRAKLATSPVPSERIKAWLSEHHQVELLDTNIIPESSLAPLLSDLFCSSCLGVLLEIDNGTIWNFVGGYKTLQVMNFLDEGLIQVLRCSAGMLSVHCLVQSARPYQILLRLSSQEARPFRKTTKKTVPPNQKSTEAGALSRLSGPSAGSAASTTCSLPPEETTMGIKCQVVLGMWQVWAWGRMDDALVWHRDILIIAIYSQLYSDDDILVLGHVHMIFTPVAALPHTQLHVHDICILVSTSFPLSSSMVFGPIPQLGHFGTMVLSAETRYADMYESPLDRWSTRVVVWPIWTSEVLNFSIVAMGGIPPPPLVKSTSRLGQKPQPISKNDTLINQGGSSCRVFVTWIRSPVRWSSVGGGGSGTNNRLPVRGLLPVRFSQVIFRTYKQKLPHLLAILDNRENGKYNNLTSYGFGSVRVVSYTRS
ncbi:hypothetical protein QBC35DRAFT_474749 [Podospora australis]|uniref:Uncharacterized protein n=1 Tax=Podospora australis TaxID=1536484 RepID=A0AAN7AHA5_9PEZI|nr:hypothetical protein QBC35DRAFT_474749 [Podospora australis]